MLSLHPEMSGNLKSSSKLLENYRDSIYREYNVINSKMASIDIEWKGESKEAFKRKYVEMRSEINSIIQLIDELSKNVMAVAASIDKVK
jgi:uncharacterized protein YukE